MDSRWFHTGIPLGGCSLGDRPGGTPGAPTRVNVRHPPPRIPQGFFGQSSLWCPPPGPPPGGRPGGNSPGAAPWGLSIGGRAGDTMFFFERTTLLRERVTMFESIRLYTCSHALNSLRQVIRLAEPRAVNKKKLLFWGPCFTVRWGYHPRPFRQALPHGRRRRRRRNRRNMRTS